MENQINGIDKFIDQDLSITYLGDKFVLDSIEIFKKLRDYKKFYMQIHDSSPANIFIVTIKVLKSNQLLILKLGSIYSIINDHYFEDNKEYSELLTAINNTKYLKIVEFIKISPRRILNLLKNIHNKSIKIFLLKNESPFSPEYISIFNYYAKINQCRIICFEIKHVQSPFTNAVRYTDKPIFGQNFNYNKFLYNRIVDNYYSILSVNPSDINEPQDNNKVNYNRVDKYILEFDEFNIEYFNKIKKEDNHLITGIKFRNVFNDKIWDLKLKSLEFHNCNIVNLEKNDKFQMQFDHQDSNLELFINKINLFY